MIAIPLPRAIERLQEETRVLHCFEQVLALVTVTLGDTVTEQTGQATEHTHLEQKDLERFRLRKEHFSHEELLHMPVAAGEGREILLDLRLCRPPLEREGHQAQPGHPAFQAGIKAPDVTAGRACRRKMAVSSGEKRRSSWRTNSPRHAAATLCAASGAHVRPGRR